MKLCYFAFLCFEILKYCLICHTLALAVTMCFTRVASTFRVLVLDIVFNSRL